MRVILSLIGIALAAGLVLLPETLAQVSPGTQNQPGMVGPSQRAQPGPGMGPGQGMQQGQPGMMRRGMADQDEMGMRGRRHGMRGKHQRMMKIAFAIADRDGDGALSFEEISDIHRRIFNAVDDNNDGLITPDEVQSFMRN